MKKQKIFCTLRWDNFLSEKDGNREGFGEGFGEGFCTGQKRSHFVVLFWPYFLSNQSGIWYTIVFWSEFFEYAKRNCVSTLVFFIIYLKKYLFSSIWELVSRLLIELQSSSKNQKNPHDQLSGVGDTFQSSNYHSFPLKPGRVKK